MTVLYIRIDRSLREEEPAKGDLLHSRLEVFVPSYVRLIMSLNTV